MNTFLRIFGFGSTSCVTLGWAAVAVEDADGPRRIIFDLENISQYEKAAGAKSEGLTFGPCCDYDKSKPVLLCDLAANKDP